MTALERRTVGSLALLYSFRMLGLFMVLPLLALYVTDMPGATPAMIGLALGVYGLSQALLQVPFGWLSDRIGRKPVILGGLAIFALGSVVAALADSVHGIVLGRALQGTGAIASTVMALVADLTREEQRTKAMALIGVSIGASFALALVLGPVIAGFAGLAGVFWFTTGLAAVGVAIVLLLVPNGEGDPVSHSDVGARTDLLGASLLNPALARLYFGVFVLHFVLMACFLVVPGFLEGLAGVPRHLHWLVYLPVLALSVVAMLPMMSRAERGGRLQHMLLLGVGLLFAGVAVLGIGSHAMLLYVGLWLFFIGFNYLEATLPSLVSKTVFAGGKGTALGIFSTCQFLGAFAGGAIGGWILQYAGLTALVFVCLGMIGLWWSLTFYKAQPTSLVAGAARNN